MRERERERHRERKRDIEREKVREREREWESPKAAFRDFSDAVVVQVEHPQKVHLHVGLGHSGVKSSFSGLT